MNERMAISRLDCRQRLVFCDQSLGRKLPEKLTVAPVIVTPYVKDTSKQLILCWDCLTLDHDFACIYHPRQLIGEFDPR